MDIGQDVFFGEDRVGVVQLHSSGLYYDLTSTVSRVCKQMMVLWVRTDHGLERIGLLAPYATGYRLVTKIAKKRLGQGSVHFFVAAKTQELPGELELLDENSAFRRLKDLTEGIFVRRGEQAGILFRIEK